MEPMYLSIQQTDQEASIRTRLHGERCPDRDGI